jgi:patatin-like phospholipase/acyl hydrolase
MNFNVDSALCVTRTKSSQADLLRSFESLDATQENYDCTIWEAASATAAPMYFKRVKFEKHGEKWSDGGIRRNNPINEALAETQRVDDLKHREIGCLKLRASHLI